MAGINVGDLLAVLRMQNEMSPELVRTAKDLALLEKAAYSAGYQITLLGRGMSEAGMVITATFTVPIVAAAKAVIDFGGEFEKQMTRVITLAGASREQVDGMRASVIQLAKDTAVGPEELAKGLYVLMSTGRTTAEALDTLKVSAQMTALGMGSMHETTLAITGAMFAYKDQNLTAADAANVLIKAVQLGNMEIQDLVPAIARVNPVAASLGVSFRDVAAGMATFTHAGVDSAVAATGMRAMLSNILTDSVKTEKGFKQLSNALGDTSISMENFRAEMKEKGFTTAMVDLMEKVTNAGDIGVAAVNKIFPNIRALTEALFTYKINGGMVVDMMKDMADGTDELSKATAELEKTWAWQWDQMKVTVQALWIELSDVVLPIFKNLLAFIKDSAPYIHILIQAFGMLPVPIQMTIMAILGFLAIAGPILIFFGQLVMAIGNISRAVPVMSSLWNAASARISAFLGIETAAVTANTAAITANTVAAETNILAKGVQLTQGGRWLSYADSEILARKRVAEAIASGAVYMESETAATVAATAATEGFGASLLAFVSSPVTLTIAGIVGVSAVVVALDRNNWDLKKTVESVWGGMKTAAKEAGEILNDVGAIIKDVIIIAWRDGIAEEQKYWDKMKAFASWVEEKMPGTGKIIHDAIFGDTKTEDEYWERVKAKYKDFKEYLAGLRAQAELYLNPPEAPGGPVIPNVGVTIGGPLQVQSQYGNLTNFLTRGFAAMGEAAKTANVHVAKNMTLLEQVNLLTTEERDKIEELKSKGYGAAAIATEMVKIPEPVIALYLKQMKMAEEATKAAERQQQELARNLSETGQAWEEYHRLEAKNQGDTYVAQMAAAKRWYEEQEGILVRLEAKDIDVSERRLAVNAIYYEKMQEAGKKEEARLASSNAQTMGMWNEYYQALNAASQDSSVKRLDQINNWYWAEYDNIVKEAANHEDAWAKLTALNATFWAKLTANAEVGTREQEQILEKFKGFDEQNNDKIYALKEQLDAEILKSHGSSVYGQIQQVEAQLAREKAILETHKNNRILQIQKLANVSDEDRAAQIEKEKQAANTISMYLQAVALARIAAIKEAVRAASIQSIISDISSFAGLFTGKTKDAITGAAGIISGLETARTESNKFKGPDVGIASALFDPEAMRAQKWAAGVSSALTIATGAMNVWTAASAAGTKAEGAFVGAMGGAQAGAAFGPWGAAIGAAAGAVTGFIRSLTAGRRAVIDFANSFDTIAAGSGFDELHQQLLTLGADGEKMWVQLTQGTPKGDKAAAEAQIKKIQAALAALDADIKKYNLDWADLWDTQVGANKSAQALYDSYERLMGAGYKEDSIIKGMSTDLNEWLGHALDAGAKIPPGMQPILEKLITMGLLTDDNKRKLLGLAEVKLNGGTFDDIMAAAGRYGLKIDQLGQKMNQLDVNRVAKQLSTDWDLLTQDGEDVNAVMAAMAPKVQDVINRSLKMGLEIPANMKPMIEAMINAGLLTDEFGTKLTDDSKLKFAAPIVDEFEQLIKKIDELIDKLGKGATFPVTVTTNYQPGNGNGTGGGGGEDNENANTMASGGTFLTTKPTLFMSSEHYKPERVSFSGEGNIGLGGSSGDMLLPITLVMPDGEVLIKEVVRVGKHKGWIK